MAGTKKRFDFLQLIKAQARFLFGNPILMLILLATTCGCAFLSYQQTLHDTGQAGLAAGLFTLIWGVIYILLPYFLVLFIVLIILAVVGILIYLGFSTGGFAGAGTAGAGMGIMALAFIIMCAIISLTICFGPGYLAYEMLSNSGSSQVVAISSAIAITIAIFATFALLYRFVFPLMFTFFWVVATGHASLKAVATILGIREAAIHTPNFSRMEFPGSIEAVLKITSELFDTYLQLIPPGPLMYVIICYAILISIAVVIKGSHLGDIRINGSPSKNKPVTN